MGKSKVAPKTAGKRKVEEEEEKPIPIPNGCPCPGMKGCTIGVPVSPGDDSVTLICSALSCPFQGIACHKICFDKYEDQLLKTLGDKGSARGWTPYKARRNLWKNNGQGLIAMCCRCICEKGNIRPPEEVVLAERILVAPVDGEKKKTKKKKDLPVINMNGGANMIQARMQARFEREEKDDERNYGRDMSTPPYTPRRTRTSSVTSFSSQSIVSTGSAVNTTRDTPPQNRPTENEQKTDGSVNRGRTSEGRRGERKKREERISQRSRGDSGISLRSPPPTPIKEPSMSPAPMTMSYAAAISTEREVSHSKDTVSKCGWMESRPFASSSSSSSLSSKWELLPERWYTRGSAGWDLATKGLFSPEILHSHEKKSGQLSTSTLTTPEWNPWREADFHLGQFTIFKLQLPSLPSLLKK